MPIDLNPVLSRPLDLALTVAQAINEEGEITGGHFFQMVTLTHTYLFFATSAILTSRIVIMTWSRTTNL